MSRQQRITISERVQGGRPVIRGTRVPVEVLVGAVAAGDAVEQVADDYAVTVADVRAALAYAADLVASERVLAVPDRRGRDQDTGAGQAPFRARARAGNGRAGGLERDPAREPTGRHHRRPSR
ncbi:MAG: DUF433 domain-containing protein [Deltaproteobacteria bacterium]|nr:DUF433 domain-containing protein [Deltaproteobacteria bacterium]